MSRLLLIDHHALLHRARNALKRTGRDFCTTDGTPTGGVLGYLNCLLSIIKSVEPTHVVVCYDAGGNARKQENADYKANRGDGPDAGFMCENRILLNEALYALGIESVGLRGYEADDLLYTLSHVAQFGKFEDRFDEVVIATVDQDLLQCVTEKCKVLLWNSAKKQQMMDVDGVVEKWGCYPGDIRYIKALAGDGSDNIAGIKGVGKKTALKIFYEAQGLAEVIADHKKVHEFRDQFFDNLKLVNLRLCTETLGDLDWTDHTLGKGLLADWEQFLFKYELNSLAKRIGKTAEMMQMV